MCWSRDDEAQSTVVHNSDETIIPSHSAAITQ
jgi:hypothetical protein